ncbi:hypothetical protein DXG01_016482 [Tephrocybe rancida]|nr:hypothetical protein DXG01_016482 [Tephrocybe rancida]
MARISFAIFDRVETVMGAIQSSFATVPERLGNLGHGNMASTTEFAPWCAQRPYIQGVAARPRNKKRRIEDSDRGSVSSIEIEGTDDSATLVSLGASQSYYEFPSIQSPRYVLGAKILPNIADFSFDAEDGASDTDTFYSYEGAQSSSPVELEDNPASVEGLFNMQKAAVVSEMIECVTALSSPPLHHSGRTRSKVVFIPRDSPGTCP